MKRLFSRLRRWFAARTEAALAGLDDPQARRDCPGGVACAPPTSRHDN